MELAADEPRQGRHGEVGLVGLVALRGSAAAGASLDPHIVTSATQAAGTGRSRTRQRACFASRGPGDLVGRIKAPTLLIQGTVDTLFTLHEAITNYGLLRANGVPTKMLWFCGGHGVCLTKPGDTGRIQRDTLAWFARYLKGRRRSPPGRASSGSTRTAAPTRLRAGRCRRARRWPGTGSGTLSLVAAAARVPRRPAGLAGAIPPSIAGQFAAARGRQRREREDRAAAPTAVVVGAPR